MESLEVPWFDLVAGIPRIIDFLSCLIRRLLDVVIYLIVSVILLSGSILG